MGRQDRAVEGKSPVPTIGAAPPGQHGQSETFRRRVRELVHYLNTAFQSLLPPDKAEQFARIAEEISASVEDNCGACRRCQISEAAAPRDPRRNRFLLRLVVGRVSHLFSAPKAPMPRSLIEGLDRYLKKAFGPIMYDELNSEAEQILCNLKAADDHAMREHIRRNPQLRRFVDTIFIRILFRFENFPVGKKTFTHILSDTMQEASNFSFQEEHFFLLFEALFRDLWLETRNDDQQVRWDFMFGDGTSKRIKSILTQGMEGPQRHREGTALRTKRAAQPERTARL